MVHVADSFFDSLRMAYAVIPFMRARGDGRVVNIISPFGTSPAPFVGMAAHHNFTIAQRARDESYPSRVFGIFYPQEFFRLMGALAASR
jgi:NAD(P)-dependent dehydrogenase (short-subunit alcohol dehydrogenase family)